MNSLENKVRDFDPNRLKDTKYTLVLFYNDVNQKDQNLFTIWQEVARSGSTISNFAAVNLRTQPELNFSHQNTPVIVVYHNQHPETFYHGPHTLEDIINYALTLNCDSDLQGLRKYRKLLSF